MIPNARTAHSATTTSRSASPTPAPRLARWPGLVEGAWFRDDLTRMDDQQHALSGLLAAAGLIGWEGA